MSDAALLVGLAVAGVFVVIIVVLTIVCCVYMHRHPRKKKRVAPIHQSTEKIRRKAEKLKGRQLRKRHGVFSCCLGPRKELHDITDLPDSPRGLQLLSHGTTEVTLRWKPPITDPHSPEFTHFKIYKRRLRQSNGWKDVTMLKSDVFEFQFEKAENDRTHVWGVATKNKSGESLIAEIQPVKLSKVQAAVPLPPYGLELQNPDPRAVTLTWKPPREDADTFPVTHFQLHVRRAMDKGGWEAVAEVKADVTEYRYTKLVTGKKYVFGVSAKNKFGESSIVQTAPMKMNKKPVLPGRPTDLSIRDQQSNNLTLCWSAPKSDGNGRITTYHVMMKDGKAAWKHVERQQAFDRDNYCKILCLEPGCPYMFKVAAENAVGIGGYAITNFVELEAEAVPPEKPSGPLVYKKIAHNSVTLSWQPPQYDGGVPVTGYAIEQQDHRSPQWQHAGVCGATPTRFTVTKIPEDIDVRFRVVAMNSAGNSPPLRGPNTRTKLLEIPTFKRAY